MRILSICLFTAGLSSALLAQTQIPSHLEVEVQNHRGYQLNADASLLAKTPNSPSTFAAPGAFQSSIFIGDIVSVNGATVKGTVFERVTSLNASTSFTPGSAIADVTRSGIYEWNLEFLNTDGTPIGRIFIQGMAGGPGPPGAPAQITRASYMVLGGTGAFLGVRGGYFQDDTDTAAPIPVTSAAEDPAYRRMNGGGNTHAHLYLLSNSTPEVVVTPAGPAVAHSSDFSLVTSSKPASAGEVLSIFATGLGPTRPGVDPGTPFPASPLAAVSSPVSVIVNGKAAEVLGAVGYPNTVNGYQVNFRVPSDVSTGTVSIQLSSAWIVGGQVKIPIQ